MLFASDLAGDLAGRLITRDDPRYDAARTVFAGAIDRRPAVIARAADAADAARIVTLARETGLELAVRSGGPAPRATASATAASSSTWGTCAPCRSTRTGAPPGPRRA